MATSLERDDIIAGLRDLVEELRRAGEVAGIRLVGGAALALCYFDRGVTHDVDSLHISPGSDDAVTTAAAKVADRHDWDASWLNFSVTRTDALPTLGRAVAWETLHDRHGVIIQVAAKEALLAMKLRANRPGRDTRDIRMLLALCGIDTLVAAESMYEDFYPGDGLSDRAIQMVEAILASGPLAVPSPPAPPDI